MKATRFSYLPGLIPVLFAVTQVLFACAAQKPGQAVPESPLTTARVPALAVKNGEMPVPPVNSTERTTMSVANESSRVSSSDLERISVLLEELAELERSGLYQREMALAESGLRERIGDYGGAVIAVFKDMLWAYGHGNLQKEDIEQALARVLALEGQAGYEASVETARALLAFVQGHWDDAEQRLAGLFGDVDEPDSFVSWILLSCALEKENGDRRAGSAYRAIRARYVQFPEYWYRGAKVFSGTIAPEYAEMCINLAPEGPFAGECRSILASFAGLREEDGSKIKSKKEIEAVIFQAVNIGNPELLEPLIPLIELAENPYTLYAIGALKSLAAFPLFRDYFDGLAAGSKGRLADRFAYISRG